jgi:hypothetical protein
MEIRLSNIIYLIKVINMLRCKWCNSSVAAFVPFALR